MGKLKSAIVGVSDTLQTIDGLEPSENQALPAVKAARANLLDRWFQLIGQDETTRRDG
jgi:hypothetical protein